MSNVEWHGAQSERVQLIMLDHVTCFCWTLLLPFLGQARGPVGLG